MTTKNQYFDKAPLQEKLFNKLLGKAFIFSPTDELWKAKRKACAHAFYKDRLTLMMETLRDQIKLAFVSWDEQIEKSADGSTVIDIFVEFERIFSRNIITIAFGEDVSEEQIEATIESPVGSGIYEPKMMSVRELLHSNTEDIAKYAILKVINPINIFLRWTG